MERRIYNIPPKAPVSVELELTSACDYRCIHCQYLSGNKLNEELSTEEFVDLLNTLNEMRVFEVTMGGGEPLLRHDFFDILTMASRMNFELILTTNGVNLTNDKADHLANVKNLAFVMYRIDAIDEEIFTEVCRGTEQMLDQSLEHIEYLLDRDVPVMIFTIITKLNLEQLPKLIRFACEKGVLALDIHEAIPLGRPRKKPEILLDSEDWSRIWDVIKSMKSYVNQRHTYIYCRSHFGMKSIELMPRREEMLQRHGYVTRYPGCRGGLLEATILSDGSVFPCKNVREFQMFYAGNIRKETFRNIWQKGEGLELLRKRTKDTLKGKCQKCQWLEYCLGGCPAISYDREGNIYSPDPRCPLRF